MVCLKVCQVSNREVKAREMEDMDGSVWLNLIIGESVATIR